MTLTWKLAAFAVSRRLQPLSALAVVLCVAGCGGPAPALPASALDVVADAPAAYGGAAPPPDPGAEGRAADAAFVAALPPGGRDHVRRDGRLDRVAHGAALALFETEALPPDGAVQWLLWRSGSTAVFEEASTSYYGTVRSSHGFGGPSEDEKRRHLDAYLVAVARRIDGVAEPRAYGIARDAGSGTGAYVTQSAVIAGDVAVVDPFPKAWAPGAEVTIHIRTLNGYTEPKLYVDLGTRVEFRSIELAADGSATVAFRAPATPGRVIVQVSALEPPRPDGEGSQATRRVLHVPLSVGVPEPRSPEELLGLGPEVSGRDLPAAARAAFDAARARAGLPPLGRDPLVEQALLDGIRAAPARGTPPLSLVVASAERAVKGRRVRRTAILRDPAQLRLFAATELLTPSFKSLLLSPTPTTLAMVSEPLPDTHGGDPSYAVMLLVYAR